MTQEAIQESEVGTGDESDEKSPHPTRLSLKFFERAPIFERAMRDQRAVDQIPLEMPR